MSESKVSEALRRVQIALESIGFYSSAQVVTEALPLALDLERTVEEQQNVIADGLGIILRWDEEAEVFVSTYRESISQAETKLDATAAAIEAHVMHLQRTVEQQKARIAELEVNKSRYRWRPIAELHEDYGPCVLINLKDPGYLEVGSNIDTDFDESDWTHFTRITPLTNTEAEEMTDLLNNKKGESKP